MRKWIIYQYLKHIHIRRKCPHRTLGSWLYDSMVLLETVWGKDTAVDFLSCAFKGNGLGEIMDNAMWFLWGLTISRKRKKELLEEEGQV